MSQKNNDNRSVWTKFDSGLWILIALAVGSAIAAVVLRGTGAIAEGAVIMLHDLQIIVPQVALGVVVGALFSIMVPGHIVSRYLGEQSGLRGLIIAEVFGALMPGGPFTSFPLVVALGRSGAGLGPLMSFLVGWEAIGIHRMLVWELPFMGADFALLRFLSGLPLPILAGLLAIWIAKRFPQIKPDFGA